MKNSVIWTITRVFPKFVSSGPYLAYIANSNYLGRELGILYELIGGYAATKKRKTFLCTDFHLVSGNP